MWIQASNGGGATIKIRGQKKKKKKNLKQDIYTSYYYPFARLKKFDTYAHI